MAADISTYIKGEVGFVTGIEIYKHIFYRAKYYHLFLGLWKSNDLFQDMKIFEPFLWMKQIIKYQDNISTLSQFLLDVVSCLSSKNLVKNSEHLNQA